MCNRESFLLLPLPFGIPVAWSISYHHEDIIKEMFPSDSRRQQFLHQNAHLEIEIPNGRMGNISCHDEPSFGLPSWFDGNSPLYYGRMKYILDKVNKLRDQQDCLHCHLIKQFGNPTFEPLDKLVYAFEKLEGQDSPEVQEFNRLVQEYRSIPGFVYRTDPWGDKNPYCCNIRAW